MKGLVPRNVAARYGQEAVEIINTGEYVSYRSNISLHTKAVINC